MDNVQTWLRTSFERVEEGILVGQCGIHKGRAQDVTKSCFYSIISTNGQQYIKDEKFRSNLSSLQQNIAPRFFSSLGQLSGHWTSSDGDSDVKRRFNGILSSSVNKLMNIRSDKNETRANGPGNVTGTKPSKRQINAVSEMLSRDIRPG